MRYCLNQFEDSPNSTSKNNDNQNSGVTKISVPECGKSPPINTEYIHTEDSQINLSISYSEIIEEIRDQIEYDVHAQRDYGDVLDEIINLITDTYCSNERYFRIGKREIPITTVRKRLSMLTAEHIEYVINSLEADGLYGN